MKSKKAVPHIVKGMPTVEPFLAMEASTKEGPGKPQKAKPLHRRFRKKHGRQ